MTVKSKSMGFEITAWSPIKAMGHLPGAAAVDGVYGHREGEALPFSHRGVRGGQIEGWPRFIVVNRQNYRIAKLSNDTQ